MAKNPKKPVPRRRRSGLSVLLLVLFLGLIAADGWMQLHAPLAVPQTTSVELAAGQRFGSLLKQMDQRGWFGDARQKLYLLAYGRLHGEALALKAGEYQLDPGTTPLQLLALLVSGKTMLHELRLVEGWRFSQAWHAILAEPNLSHSLADADDAAIMRAVGMPGVDPEGRFFPDTYRFAKGTTDVAFLKRAAQAMDKLVAAEWAQRAADLPYNRPDDALIMASLVEKETALPSERPAVAGVFIRRLRLGMRLQTDPAVIYGLGDHYDGNIHLQDLRTDTPYNTYTRDGLPPTPICLFGRESLHAALHPDQGTALYFVAKGDGGHQFSATLDEHNAAVQRYQIKPHLQHE